MAKKCMVCGDCDYNVLKQLVKLNQLLWNINGYIADAKTSKHKTCQAVFEQLRDDAEKNAEALKEIVIKKAKKGML